MERVELDGVTTVFELACGYASTFKLVENAQLCFYALAALNRLVLFSLPGPDASKESLIARPASVITVGAVKDTIYMFKFPGPLHVVQAAIDGLYEKQLIEVGLSQELLKKRARNNKTPGGRAAPKQTLDPSKPVPARSQVDDSKGRQLDWKIGIGMDSAITANDRLLKALRVYALRSYRLIQEHEPSKSWEDRLILTEQPPRHFASAREWLLFNEELFSFGRRGYADVWDDFVTHLTGHNHDLKREINSDQIKWLIIQALILRPGIEELALSNFLKGKHPANHRAILIAIDFLLQYHLLKKNGDELGLQCGDWERQTYINRTRVRVHELKEDVQHLIDEEYLSSAFSPNRA
ncbi:hypothetical protein [Dongia sedimenti]|uniref:Uncharacterized protein n=1 Tax=Dongia sedimenti TaxID=3064282 RepID=A0ABU0YHB4_9PROT|nr:hypothetical protein [Rhodospirillaceae bacterium R-7]